MLRGRRQARFQIVSTSATISDITQASAHLFQSVSIFENKYAPQQGHGGQLDPVMDGLTLYDMHLASNPICLSVNYRGSTIKRQRFHAASVTSRAKLPFWSKNKKLTVLWNYAAVASAAGGLEMHSVAAVGLI